MYRLYTSKLQTKKWKINLFVYMYSYTVCTMYILSIRVHVLVYSLYILSIRVHVLVYSLFCTYSYAVHKNLTCQIYWNVTYYTSLRFLNVRHTHAYYSLTLEIPEVVYLTCKYILVSENTYRVLITCSPLLIKWDFQRCHKTVFYFDRSITKRILFYSIIFSYFHSLTVI